MVRKMEEQNAKNESFVPKGDESVGGKRLWLIVVERPGRGDELSNPLHRVSVDIDLFVGF